MPRLPIALASRRVRAVALVLAVGFAAAAQANGSTAANPAWKQLSGAQREALAPLQEDWDQLTPDRREKWLRVADRYPSMSASERERLQARMTEWARLSPTERGQARLHFQQAQKLTPEQRQAKWAEYQALTDDERAKLAGSAKAPVAASVPARRDGAAAPKSNVVAGSAANAPVRAVAPAVVQAKPGATTTLISKPASPPPHQSAGLPKIAASPELVNHVTLLPTRGPQGAAVPAASSPAGKPQQRP